MRRALRFLAPIGSVAVLLVTLAGADRVPSAHAQGPVEQSVEYGCTGRPEPFNVPPGVAQLTVEVEGAAGNERPGASRLIAGNGRAGRGGRITGTLAVTPGVLLTITVGCVNGYGDVPGGVGGEGTSQSGFNGGGATGIRDMRQGPFGVFVVAAGGGGGGGHGFFGTEQPGGDGGDAVGMEGEGAGAGGGGTGAGAGGGGAPPARQCEAGTHAGGYGLNEGGGGGGGGGGFWFTEPTFGCGGGGGGGRLGGGGGGGGGGGLSYAGSALSGVAMGHGARNADGKVIIRFTGPAGSAPQRLACTGNRIAWTVPEGVTGLAAIVQGGGGGANPEGVAGGAGAGLMAFVTVTPGSMLDIAVGCAGGAGQAAGGGGAGGFGFYRGGAGGAGNRYVDSNGRSTTGSGHGGGGGGGASGIGVRDGDALLVGGGGGGAGGGTQYGNGGAGGAANAGNGADGTGLFGSMGGRGGRLGELPDSPFGRPDGVDGSTRSGLYIGGGGGGGGGLKGGWPGSAGDHNDGAGGGGGGRSFAHATLTAGATPFTLAASGITFFPVWGLVACPTPPSSSTVPCYDLATASAFGPSR